MIDRKPFFKIILLFICLINLSLTYNYGQSWHNLEYDSNKAPADNPLKGFMPYVGEYDFPYSLEYFYIGMAEIVKGPGTYDWHEKLEPTLNEVAERGHQAVFRIYLEYPRRPLQVPQFILDSGIKVTPYESFGGGKSPDFDHPLLVKTMLELITKLGGRYDGDPRIGFIEVGLLGHWGEFHSWPTTELFASVETQNKVLDAYEEAFHTTHVLVSQDIFAHNPMARIKDRRIGLHDDVFTRATLQKQEDHFYARLVRHEMTDIWKRVPIGGEITPGQQSCIWDIPSCTPDDYYEAINAMHPTFLLNHNIFTSDWDEGKKHRAIAGSRVLGYEFYISKYRLQEQNEFLKLEVEIQNTGLAPFYYEWSFEIALIDTNNTDRLTVIPDWDIRKILPDESPIILKSDFKIDDLPKGFYQLVIRIPNVLSGGNPIRMANRSQGKKWFIICPFIRN